MLRIHERDDVSSLRWLGAEAWFHPPPGADLPEARLGLLPPDYHALKGMMVPAPQVVQEGAYGLTFDALPVGTPIVVEGMHPEVPLSDFALPQPPALEIAIEGKAYPSPAQLTNVLFEPAHARVSVTYVGQNLEKHLAKVHGGGPIAETPIDPAGWSGPSRRVPVLAFGALVVAVAWVAATRSGLVAVTPELSKAKPAEAPTSPRRAPGWSR